MSSTSPTPVPGIPVLDVPFPRRVPSAVSPAAADRSEAEPPGEPLASAQKTILGLSPADEEDLAHRPTMPEAPMGKAGRTIVGIGQLPPAAVHPIRAALSPTEEPARAFEPSASARDPELMAPESLRLPTRRVSPADWAVLLGVLTFLVVLLAALL